MFSSAVGLLQHKIIHASFTATSPSSPSILLPWLLDLARPDLSCVLQDPGPGLGVHLALARARHQPLHGDGHGDGGAGQGAGHRGAAAGAPIRGGCNKLLSNGFSMTSSTILLIQFQKYLRISKYFPLISIQCILATVYCRLPKYEQCNK